MSGISPDSLINYSAGLDPAKFSFSAPKKINTGVIINVSYNGRPLVMRTPPLTTPFGADKGYKAEGGKQENESNKTTVMLDVPATESAAALKRAIMTVDDVFHKHVSANAAVIFGDGGLALKAKPLADKLKEVEAGTLKVYTALKPGDDSYAPKIKLSFPQTGANVINIKGGKPMEALDIGRGDQVTAVFRVKGMFVNAMMVTPQLEAAMVAVRAGSSADASAIFADIIEADAGEPSEPKAGDKRKASDETLLDEW